MAKNIRDIAEDGLRKLFAAFNEDQYFKLAQISFSKNIDHFVDRLFERKIDIAEVLSLMKKTVRKHKCEIVYFCHLDDAPLRLNIKSDKLVIGFTFSVTAEGKKSLRLRTVVENFATRNDSRISTFIIQE